MSKWISWPGAAPGVMVEVDDELEEGATPWQATVTQASAASSVRSGPAPRPLRVSRSIHPRHHRLFRPA